MNISVGMLRLPQPEAIIHAVKTYDTRILSGSLVEILLTCWPTTSDLSEFEKIKLDPGQKWGKPEAFFRPLCQLKSLQSRLIIWQFKAQFSTHLQNAKNYYDEMNEVYEIILKDKVFL
jgi:hypothetical protein